MENSKQILDMQEDDYSSDDENEDKYKYQVPTPNFNYTYATDNIEKTVMPHQIIISFL